MPLLSITLRLEPPSSSASAAKHDACPANAAQWAGCTHKPERSGFGIYPGSASPSSPRGPAGSASHFAARALRESTGEPARAHRQLQSELEVSRRHLKYSSHIYICTVLVFNIFGMRCTASSKSREQQRCVPPGAVNDSAAPSWPSAWMHAVCPPDAARCAGVNPSDRAAVRQPAAPSSCSRCRQHSKPAWAAKCAGPLPSLSYTRIRHLTQYQCASRHRLDQRA